MKVLMVDANGNPTDKANEDNFKISNENILLPNGQKISKIMDSEHGVIIISSQHIAVGYKIFDKLLGNNKYYNIMKQDWDMIRGIVLDYVDFDIHLIGNKFIYNHESSDIWRDEFKVWTSAVMLVIGVVVYISALSYIFIKS